MNINKILITSVLGFGLIGGIVPSIYTKTINNGVKQISKVLKKDGVEIIEISNKDSYFKLNRSYKLKIVDFKKLLNILSYDVNNIDTQDLEAVFNGTEFVVNLSFIKYPISHSKAVNLVLKSFNKDITAILNNSLNGKNIAKFIENKGIELFADVGISSVKRIYLKDINSKLLDVTVKGFNVSFNANEIQSKLKVFSMPIQDDTSILKIDNLKYKIKTISNINEYNSLYIQKLSLNNNFQSISMKNINLYSTTYPILNKVYSRTLFKLKDFNIKVNNEYINLDNFKVNSKINSMNLKAVENLMSNTDISKYPIYAQNLINKGFEFQINPFYIGNIELSMQQKKFILAPIKMSFYSKINENDFDINSDSYEEITKNSIFKFKLETKESNFKLLDLINPFASLYMKNFIVKKGENVVIDVNYRDSHLYISNKKMF